MHDRDLPDYWAQVERRALELQQVFDPPYMITLRTLIYKEHQPGECVQCDGYRLLIQREEEKLEKRKRER